MFGFVAAVFLHISVFCWWEIPPVFQPLPHFVLMPGCFMGVSFLLFFQGTPWLRFLLPQICGGFVFKPPKYHQSATPPASTPKRGAHLLDPVASP